ncbi:transmembrane protein 200A [Aplochiton taeniatus]
MIGAHGAITAALKRQDSSRSQLHPFQTLAPGPGQQEAGNRKRKRRADVVVVRGRLRLYSLSGFFLLLGLLILTAGIAMATLGYWPPRDAAMATLLKPTSANSTKMAVVDAAREWGGATSGANMAASSSSSREWASSFLQQHLHSERMRMLGPFTMGIGIFIFICANAILHENRDRETKVIHMRDMYSTVIDIHSLRLKEQKQQSGLRPHQEVPSTVRLAAHTLLAFSPEADLAQARATHSTAGLLSEPCVGGAGSIVSSSLSAFTLPVIKLNNCVIDEPGMDCITEEREAGLRERLRPSGSMESLAVPVASVAKATKPPGMVPPLLRSLSASSSPPTSQAPGPSSGRWLSPGAAPRDFGSNSSLHMLSSHSKSLDLDGLGTLSVKTEQRKHPSWPRLNGTGYRRLEDGEEVGAPPLAAPRHYTRREKLVMISRSHSNLSFESDEVSSMKRGASETRF